MLETGADSLIARIESAPFSRWHAKARIIVGCALAGDFRTLLAFRVIQGIGVGGEMPVAAAYISELSKAQGRGKFFMLYEMIFPVGLMATSQIGAWIVPGSGWQAMFLIGGI